MKIDLVYAWVDGNDPEWQRKKAQYQNKTIHPEALIKGRFFDNDELRFSLRSVEQYASWINHIYIVTDNQVPKWLNTEHEQITIVDHRDIIDHEYLPVFHADIIEWSIHKIPGLSEYYLYANDDMFFGNKCEPRDFFDPNAHPIQYVMKLDKLSDDLFGKGQQNTIDFIALKLGKKPDFQLGHVIDPYRKSFVEDVLEKFGQEISHIFQNRFRSENDIRRLLINAYDHFKGRRKLVYGNRNIMEKLFRKFRAVHLEKGYEKRLKKLKSRKYMLFCINDVEDTTDDMRMKARQFLQEYFPVKSAFEK